MLKEVVIMLNYAPVKNESYYAQNYASIMCQGLPGVPNPPLYVTDKNTCNTLTLAAHASRLIKCKTLGAKCYDYAYYEIPLAR